MDGVLIQAPPEEQQHTHCSFHSISAAQSLPVPLPVHVAAACSASCILPGSTAFLLGLTGGGMAAVAAAVVACSCCVAKTRSVTSCLRCYSHAQPCFLGTVRASWVFGTSMTGGHLYYCHAGYNLEQERPWH